MAAHHKADAGRRVVRVTHKTIRIHADRLADTMRVVAADAMMIAINSSAPLNNSMRRASYHNNPRREPVWWRASAA